MQTFAILHRSQFDDVSDRTVIIAADDVQSAIALHPDFRNHSQNPEYAFREDHEIKVLPVVASGDPRILFDSWE